MYIKY